MPIVEDYEAIAKRLRELKTAAPKSAERVTELERRRKLARETARTYVGNRRQLVVFLLCESRSRCCSRI